jgi:uncharacterized OsmC-like protein
MSSLEKSSAQPAVLNGVNVTALIETIAAVSANAELAKFNFRATNRWLGGDKNRTIIKGFTGALQEHRTDSKGFVVDNGEPPVLLGTDHAPNAGEWLLHSLVGCLTGTVAYHAAARGIEIEAIESKIDGDIDLRGFLGLSDEVRKGYSAIRVAMRVKTQADSATIKPLTMFSPMFDVVSRSVPVTIDLQTY